MLWNGKSRTANRWIDCTEMSEKQIWKKKLEANILPYCFESKFVDTWNICYWRYASKYFTNEMKCSSGDAVIQW